MAAIVHKKRAAASTEPAPLDPNRRPTRLDPVACDCCGRAVGYFDSTRYELSMASCSMPYVVCHTCTVEDGDGASLEQRLRMIVTRAERFGQQHLDAVRSMLGWRA